MPLPVSPPDPLAIRGAQPSWGDCTSFLSAASACDQDFTQLLTELGMVCIRLHFGRGFEIRQAFPTAKRRLTYVPSFVANAWILALVVDSADSGPLLPLRGSFSIVFRAPRHGSSIGAKTAGTVYASSISSAWSEHLVEYGGRGGRCPVGLLSPTSDQGAGLLGYIPYLNASALDAKRPRRSPPGSSALSSCSVFCFDTCLDMLRIEGRPHPQERCSPASPGRCGRPTRAFVTGER